MAPGEAWVFNIWDVHAVTNVSDVTRIHLVADFQPQGRLFDLMFRDSSKDEILTTMGYRYPRDYRTDAETMDWLTVASLRSASACGTPTSWTRIHKSAAIRIQNSSGTNRHIEDKRRVRDDEYP